MKENVGRADQAMRTVLGPALISLGYLQWGGNEGRLPGLAAIVAGTMVVESAITRVCPLNRVLGIDTRSEKQKERDFRASLPLPQAPVTSRAWVSPRA